ncbi:dephospho-CoA kinase [bacterium]|nr:dephospho-CoA kinase [bacterium]
MRVVGLVGGIGSGKSTVAAMLAELGALVIEADAIGHGIYRAGTPGFDAVVRAFGAGVVGEDGEIDRRRLAPIVFGDPARLAELNAIVHPRIRAEIERRIEDARAAGRVRAVAVEAAILIEAGWRDLVDLVWVVVAPRERIVERLASGRGIDRADAEARMRRQMSDEERRAAADLVIENDGGLEDLRGAVARAWKGLVGA